MVTTLSRIKTFISTLLVLLTGMAVILAVASLLYLGLLSSPSEETAPPETAPEETETIPETEPGPPEIPIGGMIGMSVENLREQYGKPVKVEASEYEFDWHTYHQAYEQYMLIGIRNGMVVAAYSHITPLEQGIDFTSSRQEVHEIYGDPMEFYQKDDAMYATTTNPQDYEVFDRGRYFLTAFYDQHESSRVTGTMLVERETELNKPGFYGNIDHEVLRMFERQNFDIVNAERVQRGLLPFEWDERMADVSREHSRDMAFGNYFDHINPRGEGPYERLVKVIPDIGTTSENLAAGGNAIHSHHGLMNSPGHRENLLRTGQTHMGVGAAYNPDTVYLLYFTQLFTDL
jgi:uncharacterized protein YkwD